MFWEGFFKQAALREGVQLQPHQERAGKKLERSGGLLVYHGLGSGKTLTSMAATQGDKTDIIVPAGLRTHYGREIPHYTTGYKPNVMSYEKAMKTPPQGEAVIVDEAHALGNPETKRSQMIMQNLQQYKKRILLTGTPIRNHPEEIAPLLRAVRGDKAVPQEKAFREQFIEEVKHDPGFFNRMFHGAKPGVSYRMKNKKAFKDLAEGYIDYHAPSSENFPTVSHEVVEAPMSAEQMKYYDYVLGKAGPTLRWKIRSGLPPSKAESANLNSFLSGARQVSNSPAAFGGKASSPKIDRAVNELKAKEQKDPNFRGLVYSNYLDSGVKSYAQQLDKHHIPYAIFDGSLSDKKRKDIINGYNAGKFKVLLISGAGSQGLDLKGTKLVQLLEPAWNNPRLQQATGRAIRYKSHEHLPSEERHVHVQRFHSTIPQTMLQKYVTKGKHLSTDQYLDMLSKEKEQLNNQFLDVLKEVGNKNET